MKLSEKLATVTYWETGNQAAPIEERIYGFDREPRQWAAEAQALEERIEAYECLQRTNRKALDSANARVADLEQGCSAFADHINTWKEAYYEARTDRDAASARVAKLENLLREDDAMMVMKVRRATARAEAAEAKLKRVRDEARGASQWDDAGKDWFDRERIPARILAIIDDKGSDK